MTEELKDLRDWLFRGLMFEAEAERFRSAGIRIGADMGYAERSIFEETLAPFPIDLRNESLQMAHLYSLVFCFENSVRDLIKEKLQEKHKEEWWTKGVPVKVQQFAESRQESAKSDSWLEGMKSDLLGFVEFGHLSDIIVYNWDDFSDLVPSQHWLKQRMDELEKARHFIAHNRILLPSEFSRIEMYIADWNKMVGL